MVDEGDDKVENHCSWIIDGIDEAGVYPIRPCKSDWYLDQRCAKPKLNVKRYQLPLAPAYSIAAHGSQGQTLRAAMLDLAIGRGVSLIASYVAMTRARRKEDLLIYREFLREVFAQGAPEGPSLLLRQLRGDRIDWRAVEDKHAPQRKCKGPCFSVKPKAEFSQTEWLNKEDAHWSLKSTHQMHLKRDMASMIRFSGSMPSNKPTAEPVRVAVAASRASQKI